MDEKGKLPQCCGEPVSVFPMCCGESDWVCHCKNCWDGTMPQPTRELAIEAWDKECT